MHRYANTYHEMHLIHHVALYHLFFDLLSTWQVDSSVEEDQRRVALTYSKR